MNLNQLREELSRPLRLCPIGRTVELEGQLCHLAGLCLTGGGQLSLLALIPGLDLPTKEEPPQPRTNREQLLRFRPACLPAIREVTVGTERWQSGESRGESAAQHLPALCGLLRRGWDPGVLGGWELDQLTLLRVDLEGECAALPTLDAQTSIRLGLGWQSRSFPVQLPLALSIGGEYPNPLSLTDPDTGEEYLLQIQQVTLLDPLQGLEELLSSPKMAQQHSPQELDRLRRETRQQLAAICPPGMLLPVVEYGCREGSAEFYGRDWLAAPYRPRSRDFWFRVTPEKPIGKGGLPLRCCVLNHPIPPETRALEGELLLFHRMTPPKTVEVPAPTPEASPPQGPDQGDRRRMARKYLLEPRSPRQESSPPTE